MTTQITDNSDAVVVCFRCGEIVNPDCIADAAHALQNGRRLAIEQSKSLRLDLRGVGTLSAAAIGRFVQAGKLALDSDIDVQFIIPAELEGMFRVLHLDNLFDVTVESRG